MNHKRKYTETEIESFLELLLSRDGATREMARKSLVAVGKPAVHILTEASVTPLSLFQRSDEK